MVLAEYVFWVCGLVVVHTYVLYPVFLAVASSLVRQVQPGAPAPSSESEWPAVTLIVPAYNEEAHLAAKLANIRAIDYPPGRLEVVFVSDGSTDSTNRILEAVGDADIRSIVLPERHGKASALNCGVEEAKNEILVCSDAATLFEPDAIRMLVRHFADPTVGVVCGVLRFRASTESRQTEGVYWKYETWLRLMEARLGLTLTASGAIYALRRQCYAPLASETIVEDLLVPMNARTRGYRILYDSAAVGTDFAASTVAGEFSRRVRVAMGSFQAFPQLLRIRLDALTSFALVSHKFLRWVLPFPLLGLLVTSGLLRSHSLQRAAFVAQVIFYAWAGLGFLFRRHLGGIRYALIAYYLVAIHLAFLVGFVRFVAGHRDAAWRRIS